MSNQLKISDLDAGQLDSACVTILAKMCRILASHNIAINLQDKDLLKKINLEVRYREDKQLTVLHAQLKVALKSYVNTEGFKAKLPMYMNMNKRKLMLHAKGVA